MTSLPKPPNWRDPPNGRSSIERWQNGKRMPAACLGRDFGQVPWSRTTCSKLTWRGSRPVMRQKSLTRKQYLLSLIRPRAHLYGLLTCS